MTDVIQRTYQEFVSKPLVSSSIPMETPKKIIAPLRRLPREPTPDPENEMAKPQDKKKTKRNPDKRKRKRKRLRKHPDKRKRVRMRLYKKRPDKRPSYLYRR